MRFKTMRLVTLHNELNHTICANGGLEPLQMTLEPDTGQCASKDAGPQRSRM